MRHPLKRFYGRGDVHFITFSCYRRQPLLGTARARNRFVKILDQVRARHDFKLIGYLVMPEHVHLLLTEPCKGTPSKILQVLKQKVSAALRKGGRRFAAGQLELKFPEPQTAQEHFWQRRFYDFNVCSEKKLSEKLNYMHRNPVERRLVGHPKDWMWSSWSHYENKRQGLLRIDALK